MKLKKLGILVKSLTNDHLSTVLIKAVNHIVETTDIDVVIFREDITNFRLRPKCALMHTFNAWDFDGVCISTDISTTKTLIATACPIRKFFYVWNLEWLYQDNLTFDLGKSVYMSDEIQLIARSNQHYEVLANSWREPAMLMEDFNGEKLKTLF